MAQVTVYQMTPDPRPKRWRRQFGYYAIAEDGEIYLPGIVAYGAMPTFLAAAFDGVGYVRTGDGVLLYPVTWMCREFPDCADDIGHIVMRIHTQHEKGASS
jgi:hypothetical protein